MIAATCSSARQLVTIEAEDIRASSVFDDGDFGDGSRPTVPGNLS